MATLSPTVLLTQEHAGCLDRQGFPWLMLQHTAASSTAGAPAQCALLLFACRTTQAGMLTVMHARLCSFLPPVYLASTATAAVKSHTSARLPPDGAHTGQREEGGRMQQDMAEHGTQTDPSAHTAAKHAWDRLPLCWCHAEACWTLTCWTLTARTSQVCTIRLHCADYTT